MDFYNGIGQFEGCGNVTAAQSGRLDDSRDQFARFAHRCANGVSLYDHQVTQRPLEIPQPREATRRGRSPQLPYPAQLTFDATGPNHSADRAQRPARLPQHRRALTIDNPKNPCSG